MSLDGVAYHPLVPLGLLQDFQALTLKFQTNNLRQESINISFSYAKHSNHVFHFRYNQDEDKA